MKTSVYTPFEVGGRDRVVGFFVIGAVLLFLVGFLIPFIQDLQSEEGVSYYTVLDQTYGIAPDAVVSLRGVVVGKVTTVRITDKGMVRVDVSLSPDYVDFYTLHSRLSVDTNITASTILTGSGLVLHPGGPDDGPLKPGEMIITEPPRGIGSILEELDVTALTEQITQIVANVEQITSGVNQNQGKLYASLDNLETVTASLAEVSRTLPGMVASVEASLLSMQNSLAGVDTMIANTDEDLQATLQNTVLLTEQATKTLAEAETLFQSTTPVLNQLPTILVTTDVALQSLTELTDQLSRSWLLGGDGSTPEYAPEGPTPHPHDDSLYQAAPSN